MDKELKKKLEGLEPQYDPKHWDEMAERLDQEGLTPLEGAIVSKLDAVSPNPPVDAWTKFEAARTSKFENEWDNKVREKLSAESDGTPHWPLMMQKMEAWKALRRRYITLRTAEVVIILLLLLTFHQYEGIWMPNPIAGRSFEAGVDNIQTSSVSEEQVNELTLEGFEDPSSTEGDLTETAAAFSKAQTAGSDDIPSIGELKTESTDSRIKSFSVDEKSTPTGEPANSTGKSLTALNTLAYTSNSLETAAHPVSKNGFESWFTPKLMTLRDVFPILFAEPVSLSPFDTEHLKTSFTSIDERHRWLSIYGFGGINQIRTPSDDRFESNTAYSTSYGSGIELSFQQERLTWGFGVEYQITSIHPDRSIRIGDNSTGFITATFEQVDLDFINIPLHVRYNFIDRNLEDWYAYGGIRLHMSSSIRYSFDTVMDGPPPPGQFTFEDAKELHNVSETNFTLSAGVGYQRTLNDRWILFGQAGLDLFGQNSSLFPNGEVIHVLRGDLGLRFGF